jgi:hypothetical protein
MDRNRRSSMGRYGALSSLIGVALLATAPAHAASLSFFINQSNVSGLPDGENYLQVTIADGADGAIDFEIEPLRALLDRATDRFDIRAFAFNIADGFSLSAANIVAIPDSFRARGTSRMDGFGRFEMTLFATGPERPRSLSFSIVGIEGDTPLSYVELSSGNAGQGNVPFAARVRNLFELTDCDPDRKCTPNAIPSAFVGGGDPVPLPATAWFLLTGIAAVAARARRRLSRSA